MVKTFTVYTTREGASKNTSKKWSESKYSKLYELEATKDIVHMLEDGCKTEKLQV